MLFKMRPGFQREVWSWEQKQTRGQVWGTKIWVQELFAARNSQRKSLYKLQTVQKSPENSRAEGTESGGHLQQLQLEFWDKETAWTTQRNKGAQEENKRSGREHQNMWDRDDCGLWDEKEKGENREKGAESFEQKKDQKWAQKHLDRDKSKYHRQLKKHKHPLSYHSFPF